MCCPTGTCDLLLIKMKKMKKDRLYRTVEEKSRRLLLGMLLALPVLTARGQVVIGGNVYGGARQADVNGSTYVNIGAVNHDILINAVYGGNDIAGQIGTSETMPFTPSVNTTDKTYIDNTYNAFVHISPETGTGTDSQTRHLFIGNLFGGGNGDYDYTLDEYKTMSAPVLGKTYLQINGGTIAFVYGGGNNATVTGSTDICINNISRVTTEINVNGTNLLNDKARLAKMGIAMLEGVVSRDKYQFSRVFGGNNKAPMAILPKWHLEKGIIENLYSGGNAGHMTSNAGLLLEIDPPGETDEEKEKLEIANVYGGCRKANVCPGGNENAPLTASNADLNTALGYTDKYKFPNGLSARVLIRGGKIYNVYGGNDISGKVYGGNAVGIYSTVYGDVYGGGNGSYAYTDNPLLKDDLYYGDYYYDKNGDAVASLNAFRPNAEQVSIRLAGTATKKTTIHGGVYVGGNSATLATTKSNPLAELKIGSHVIADKVFLGNNGRNMVDSGTGGVLRTLKRTDVEYVDDNGETKTTFVNDMDLTQETQMSTYMEGCAMSLMPAVVFDDTSNGDPANYEAYTSAIGSIYCGGNVGSMTKAGKTSLNFQHEIIVFNKVVGGCNDANVPAVEGVNAAYNGGLLGSPDEKGDKLELTFSGLKVQPKRWKMNGTDYATDDNGNHYLEWNTISAATGLEVDPVTTGDGGDASDNDIDRRFKGGNIYGGCYNSGHVNGNVIINVNASIVDLDGEFAVFDKVTQDEDGEAKLNGHNTYNIEARRSGVIRAEQGMDALGSALNMFGGGYGEGSEIWGSVTINMNKGYAFQIFGGGEMGAIGKEKDSAGNYTYDEKYSTTINLKGAVPGQPIARDKDADKVETSRNLAETEFIYGGGFEGPIAGNTRINLGNGRVFDTFAGSCNADILGHTETYIGYDGGLPYVRDDVYGGNDLGGRILGQSNKSFKDRLRTGIINKVYGYSSSNTDPEQLTASAYIEYIQGRVDTIFGGCYGYYNYKNSKFRKYTYTTDATDTNDSNIGRPRPGFTKPCMDNAFVNFRPENTSYEYNNVLKIHGGGQGYPGEVGKDSMQHRSYVLIDIPDGMSTFERMEVFGAGAYGGLGMGIQPDLLVDRTVDGSKVAGQPDKASAIIDLVRGQIHSVYGASYKQGFTRRTVVNVPEGSTIHLQDIFGGAYGYQTNSVPCDAYEAIVNYKSDDAIVEGAIYGGNNSFRRTLYGTVNIHKPVWANQAKTKRANVYGAGYGKDSWSQYTEVNLFDGAEVQYVYGGGNAGRVLSKKSVEQWAAVYRSEHHDSTLYVTLGEGYTDTGLDNALAHSNELYKWDSSRPEKYNTNVHIYRGAVVQDQARDGALGTDGGYAYAGGEGADADVCGTTYIDVLGGLVKKDLYAGGYGGAVEDFYGDALNEDHLASATAYLQGGKVRKIYGGGYQGHIGRHASDDAKRPVAGATTGDVLANSYVVIGIREDQSNKPADYGYYHGVPTVEFNAYGGGEGGSVFGTANLTLNNAFIGYRYSDTEPADQTRTVVPAYGGYYQEKLDDETWTGGGINRLIDCGNVFGGGYDDLSTCDFTNTIIWGGKIRNSLFGGGEIATVGRGATKQTTGAQRDLEQIWKHGGTHIEMYNGHVMRDVFGGGKGYNELKYGESAMLYTDGYVFGQTEVYIHGGEVGTTEGVAKGYGNVFGGGDIGYVYGKGKKGTASSDYTGSPGHYYYYDDNHVLTEDCKVVIAPYLQKKSEGTKTIGTKEYKQWDYVETDDLNTILADKDNDGNWQGVWLNDLFTGDADKEEERGVTIRNAVFAGGNVSSNSDVTYANASTVFGNTTATLYDVYYRDFITVGTEHIGGLYGGGNLSVVDGYRELNVTNYGTDYYGLDDRITYERYQRLSSRERAYFQLQYECKTACNIEGKEYKVGDKVTEEDYDNFPEEYKTDTYWKQYGFCSIYAGRLLNTIQRADLCGVYGSRMVLQGAKDRVADKADLTVYTINRVGELSLNKQKTIANDNTDQKEHGNYFGIYSIVNYLGHLTSDVKFDDYRQVIETVKDGTGDDAPSREVTTTTDKKYWEWKTSTDTKVKDRNIGTCHNQVALASGVYLEVTTEESTTTNKIYGDITGIVELDLINIRKELSMGGGYVYARNEHGNRSYHPDLTNVILSPFNKGRTVGSKDMNIEARTFKRYTYDGGNRGEFETSGNFIHRSKRIIDDCYPHNGAYTEANYEKSPAHYWYIKGDVYVYDQSVSAYVGSASAYSKEVKIPLTITAGSNGKLQLLNVQPSKYAYYSSYDNRDESHKITSDGVKVDNERTTYYLNDVVSWWDWQLLSREERMLFVKETYINADTCYVDGSYYPAGTYVLEHDPSIHGNDESLTAYKQFVAGAANHTFADKNNETYKDASGKPMSAADIVAKVFHSSNNISHDKGYVVTFDMDTPGDWNDWYTITKGEASDKKNKSQYEALSDTQKLTYTEGPTFRLKEGQTAALYGQKDYAVGDIISKEIYDDYINSVTGLTLSGQATVAPAYINEAGNVVPETEKTANDVEALLCTNTLQLATDEYVLQGEIVAKSKLDELAQKYMDYHNSLRNEEIIENIEDAKAEVLSHLVNAYVCTEAGKFGGQHFKTGQNYTAIKSWCSLTDDRQKFEFNYDAFDVLIDPEYSGDPTKYKSPYSDAKPVEYEAVYTGTGTLTYRDEDGTSHTLASGGSITREEFENVRNAQRHFTRVNIPVAQNEDPSDKNVTIYIVKQNFHDKGTPYAVGSDISQEEYNALDDEHRNADYVKAVTTTNTSDVANVMYYCYDAYSEYNEGTFITPTTYISLPNDQKNFVIRGVEPTETTMLYVSRESVAKDVMKEKIISVVYQYTYYDDDSDGEGVSLINELHVVNIHLQLESGVPEIGELNPPTTVLPGKTVKLTKPEVIPGMYEVLISGWEMYTDKNDAENHRDGKQFQNNSTPVYWYQNEKLWVAFYSETYLGRTYSNPVEISVANYHDLGEVMADKAHHLYVDHPQVERESKIYIDNLPSKDNPDKSKLDLLKDFFDLSVQTSTDGTAGHAPLDSHVRAGRNLEFFLNSDVSPKAYTNWTPIGKDNVYDYPDTPADEGATGQCFDGTLHGDGHTISGLSNSLFGHLCGDVYNLGVTGSFTGAGIADEGYGYMENCWVKSTATVNSGVKAAFGNPLRSTGVQVVNCYYPETNGYSQTTHDRGNAIKMPEQAFYNGTVAYNLNGFYLNKRYHDNKQTGGTRYYYLKSGADGTLPTAMTTGYYPSSPDAKYGDVGYVEKRFEDGDFIYADGRIPEGVNSRLRTTTGEDTNGEQIITIHYVPIWPDDYLYFGQMLTYNWTSRRAHEDKPSHIVKSGDRLATDDNSNRVYRAPAYFGNSTMSVAHFNRAAYLPAYSKPNSDLDTDLKAAYPGMTAIDFAGHNDLAYQLGYNDNRFYTPLLDDGGLQSIMVNGQTQNLLAYAPGSANTATDGVLNGYFVEPAYSESTDGYRTVPTTSTSSILGHLVQSDLTTASDHLLVDKQDFNCPIAYRLGDGYRMWYQRTPSNYVTSESGKTKGWEGISLPFSAELVTTPDKGEITHFYEGSTTGHEYWLREFSGIDGSVGNELPAKFTYPAAGSESKAYTNTFLWDYYYSKSERKDNNTDIYQTYYKDDHTFAGYPFYQGGTPYLAGFPGKTYYEFDLSGNFVPQFTMESIAKLAAQSVIFVSAEKASIHVSDTEETEGRVTKGGYVFCPTYSGKKVAAGGFLLNADGSKFVMQTTETNATPFRPYFIKSTTGTRSVEDQVSSIVFIDEASNLKGTVTGIEDLKAGDDLLVSGGRKKITVESQLRYTTDVSIVTPSGVTMKTFSIQPSEYVETRVETAGVYIVYADNGKYVRKVIVR